MNAGKVRISEKLLFDWLRFEDGRIIGCQWDYTNQTLLLIISHPDLPQVKEGEAYPEVSPSYRRMELVGFRVERVVG